MRSEKSAPGALLLNLLLLYIVYGITRLAFFLENYATYDHLVGADGWWSIVVGGLYFDTSAIAYTNALYVLLVLLPIPQKEGPLWQRICKWLFVVVNSLGLAMNLGDSVYFQYTARRTTIAFFSEFSGDEKLGSIVGYEFIQHWYLVLLFLVLAAVLWWCYVVPRVATVPRRRYYLCQCVSLLIAAYAVFAGIRGGLWDNRPIKISTANQFIIKPNDASLILNTPFTMIRTIGHSSYHNPAYFTSNSELESIYSPLHTPVADSTSQKKNIVVIFLESFGREYIGALNKSLDDGRYKGYTPFVDSLIARSVTFTHSYCNGRKSIDGMPSILSSIPMFVEPFFLTPASMNHVSGIARLLGNEGYETAFFHGAQRGSMGFQAFANATGFKAYYGREDFNADSRFGNDDDFDGTWAIWDEPFLQYYGAKMSEMKEPFMTAVFTASSHHPYVVPEKYQDVYPEEGLIIHKCIRYTDMAIRKFFERVSHEPWFHNTIFVLTSDHTNLSDHAYYQTDLGGFCSPIIIYEPGNQSRIPEIQDKIAQQIDILPTVMGMLHYPRPYFAFGIDLFNTPPEETWAVNYLNGIYQYVKKEHVLQFDGEKTIGIYALSDSLMQNNLNGQLPDQPWMEQDLKAIIQQYMSRMVEDRLMP